MKTAVCLAGHLRTYAFCAESLVKHIIKPLSADVFLHTSDQMDYPGTVSLGPDAGRALVLYKPRAMVVEKDQTFEQLPPVRWGSAAPRTSVLQMWYRIRRVMELCQQSGAKYDLVIRCRPDHRFNAPIPVHALRDTTKLWLATSGHWASGLSDQFAFGSSETMFRYGTLLAQLETYTKLNPELVWTPEMLAEEHFGHLGVPVDFVEVDMDLIRRHGQIQPHELSRIGTAPWWSRLQSHEMKHTYGFKADGSRTRPAVAI